jgi:sulfur relay protein TusB/DsrH
MSSASEGGVLHLLSSAQGMVLPEGLLISLSAQDSIVLLADAVLLALAGNALDWALVPEGVQVLALQSDLEQRGLGAHALHPHVERGDDLAWVIASERHPRSISWGGGR